VQLYEDGGSGVFHSLSSLPPVEDKHKKHDKRPANPVGLRLHGWNIVTVNSPISTEAQEKEFSSFLADQCDHKKKLAPPELLFYNAFVSVSRFTGMGVSDGQTTKASTQEPLDAEGTQEELRITARAALGEWADAHQFLKDNEGDDTDGSAMTSYRGVSVLKTADAMLWESKLTRGKQTGSGSGSAPEGKDSTAFDIFLQSATARAERYLDWTYSTPYAGNSFLSDCCQWIPCITSGIGPSMSLLTDRTQPILLFDDVTLYEDDLHDNGQVQLSVKVRVMPTCFFLLQRLFLRVDNVIVRCRDTRILCKFEGDGNHRSSKMYRDVQWRECVWGDLELAALPSDVKSWTDPHCASLLPRLPLVELPPDIPQHSVYTCQ
jgi:hypothetical protein